VEVHAPSGACAEAAERSQRQPALGQAVEAAAGGPAVTALGLSRRVCQGERGAVKGTGGDAALPSGSAGWLKAPAAARRTVVLVERGFGPGKVARRSAGRRRRGGDCGPWFAVEAWRLESGAGWRCQLRLVAQEDAVTRSLQRGRENLMLSSGVLARRRWSRWRVNVKRARVIER
jgi:hypothetical protein